MAVYGTRVAPGGYPRKSGVPASALSPSVKGLTVYPSDPAIPVADGIVVFTKGSAAAATLAAPTAGTDDGTEIVLLAGSAFAHVVTCASGVLQDGTTGAKTTCTLAAFLGASARLVAYNGKWNVISKSVATVA